MAPIPWSLSTSRISHEGWLEEALLQAFIERMAPIPWSLSTSRIPHEGWLEEALLQALMCNRGWLKKFAFEKGEGTLKGICAGFEQQHKRSAVIRYEITNSYKVGHHVDGGVRLLNNPKMCTWLHGERDTTKTGRGTFDVAEKAFAHMVWSQIGPTEEVLRPDATGFSKRFHATWITDKADAFKGQQFQDQFTDQECKAARLRIARLQTARLQTARVLSLLRMMFYRPQMCTKQFRMKFYRPHVYRAPVYLPDWDRGGSQHDVEMRFRRHRRSELREGGA